MLATCCALALLAQAPAVTRVPAPTGLEKTLMDQAQGGQLKDLGLLEAALIASGVPEANLRAEADAARAALAPAIAKAKLQKDVGQKGKALLRALHETVLRGYAADASEVDGVVHTGRFNCVSSALLFIVAAEGLLDAPRAVVTPHHAFVRVTVGARDVDVETTTRVGFDPDRSTFTQAQVQQLAGAEVSAEQFREGLAMGEELPPLSLVAAIYSNRAVGLANRGDLAATALALDRGARLASGGLKSRLADWRASTLARAGHDLIEANRLDDAKRLLELALEVTDSKYEHVLKQNLAVVHQRVSYAAYERNDWPAAIAEATLVDQLGFVDLIAVVRGNANGHLAAAEGTDARCTGGDKERTACLAILVTELAEHEPERALGYARAALALSKDGADAHAAMLVGLDRQARAQSKLGHCEVVEALVKEGLPFAHVIAPTKWEAERLMGTCWVDASGAAFDAKDWDTAAKLLERARVHLGDEVKEDLARVDLNRAIDLAADGDCERARPSALRAAHASAALAPTATKALASCAAVRGAKAADAHDWERAAAEYRAGLRDAPKDDLLLTNLRVAVHNLASRLLKDKQCAKASSLKSELRPDDPLLPFVAGCR